MSAVDHDQIRARLAAAHTVHGPDVEDPRVLTSDAWSAVYEHAPTDLAALLEENERLAATVARVEALLPEMEADIPADNGNATAQHITQILRAALEGGESQ